MQSSQKFITWERERELAKMTAFGQTFARVEARLTKVMEGRDERCERDSREDSRQRQSYEREKRRRSNLCDSLLPTIMLVGCRWR